MNIFPRNSNPAIAHLIPALANETMMVLAHTKSKSATAVYFSLLYYFAVIEQKPYEDGYNWLCAMSGYSLNTIKRACASLRQAKLISTKTLWIKKTKTRRIVIGLRMILPFSYLKDARVLLEKVRILSSEYLNSSGQIIDSNLTINEPRSIDYDITISKTTHGLDLEVLAKFYNGLRAELDCYDSKLVEQEIKRSQRSIESRTKIRNPGQYLATIRKNMIKKLSKAQRSAQDQPPQTEKQTIFTPQQPLFTDETRSMKPPLTALEQLRALMDDRGTDVPKTSGANKDL